jgi:serine/threonine protein kinase
MADPTKLDVPIPAPTRLDSVTPAPTLLDSGAAPGPHIHVQLPPSLAARFRIERQFPAHGAEAEVLLVWPLTGAGRVVLKLYRSGIRPKTEVLERIARAAPEHVVQLFEHGQADGVWYEVLEYAPHGSLRDLMHGPVAPEQALAVLDELSAALGYLHTQQIIHRDLKPENVLIRRLQPLDLALTDFGIASVSEFSQHHTNLSRTVRYSAPETLSGVLSAKADWWSLGLVLLEMLGGKHPFDGLSDAVILHWLITRPVDVTAVSDPAWNTLCRGLLLRDPQQRWDLAEIQRWRRGENVAVASENAPAATPETSAQRPYKIGGESCCSAEQLGRALAQHWTEAVKHLERDLILGWVRDEFKDQVLASFVMDLTAENLPADEKLLKLIRQLAPDLPPVYRGIAISSEDLFKLAQQAAQGDSGAEELFWNIYERDILGYFPQDMRLQQLREAWRQGIEDYQSGWEDVIQAGAPPGQQPELRTVLPSLYLSVFSSPKELEAKLDALAKLCIWLQPLNPTDNPKPAHLPILLALSQTAKKTILDDKSYVEGKLEMIKNNPELKPHFSADMPRIREEYQRFSNCTPNKKHQHLLNIRQILSANQYIVSVEASIDAAINALDKFSNALKDYTELIQNVNRR